MSVIARAASLGLPYLYLGNYVAACKSLSYKERFNPLEVLGPDGKWRNFKKSEG